MPGNNDRQWMRYAGIGVEFAAAVIGLSLLGFWFDRRFKSSPWGLLTGVALGLTGGTYNFIREALKAFHEADERDERDKRDKKNG